MTSTAIVIKPNTKDEQEEIPNEHEGRVVVHDLDLLRLAYTVKIGKSCVDWLEGMGFMRIATPKSKSYSKKVQHGEDEVCHFRPSTKGKFGKVLVVAHLDYVTWCEATLEKEDERWFLYGVNDDRIGVYSALLLQQMGLDIDILFTDNEETGNSTAQDANSWFNLQDARYNWVVEFDRGGTTHALYDNLSNRPWVDAIEDSSGLTCSPGSFTDICYLDIPGNPASVNWATTYINPHSSTSKLDFTSFSLLLLKFYDFYEEHKDTYFEGAKWTPRLTVTPPSPVVRSTKTRYNSYYGGWNDKDDTKVIAGGGSGTEVVYGSKAVNKFDHSVSLVSNGSEALPKCSILGKTIVSPLSIYVDDDDSNASLVMTLDSPDVIYGGPVSFSGPKLKTLAGPFHNDPVSYTGLLYVFDSILTGDYSDVHPKYLTNPLRVLESASGIIAGGSFYESHEESSTYGVPIITTIHFVFGGKDSRWFDLRCIPPNCSIFIYKRNSRLDEPSDAEIKCFILPTSTVEYIFSTEEIKLTNYALWLKNNLLSRFNKLVFYECVPELGVDSDKVSFYSYEAMDSSKKRKLGTIAHGFGDCNSVYGANSASETWLDWLYLHNRFSKSIN